MNKKNVSFVLAFVLSIGLGFGGVSSAFASNDWASDMATQTLPEYTVNASSTSTGIGAQAGNQAVYKLSAVFNYAAGIMTSSMDANRNITLMSMNQPKAMLVYDDATNSWTPASMNISGTDWSEITKTQVSQEVLDKFNAAFPNATDEEVTQMAQLYQFLLNAGVPEASLTVSSATGSGTKQDNQVVSAWFFEAVSELKQGVSHSISLNFTATGGSTCTVSEYGKPQATLGSEYTTAGEALVVEAYIYDADGKNDGLLDAVYRINYEAKERVDGSGNPVKDSEGNTIIDLEKKYTVEIYNNYLQASTTISMGSDNFNKLVAGTLSIADIQQKAAEGGSTNDFKVITTTQFNNDGSIAKTTDADGNYTIYAGSVKITYNKEGTITGRTEDLGNGYTISESYGKNNTVTSRTYVHFGRVTYTETWGADSTNKPSPLLDDENGQNTTALDAAVKASKIYDEYRRILLAGGSDVNKNLGEWRNANPNIKDVALYGSTLASLGAESLRAIFSLATGATDQDYLNFKAKLLAMDNGVSQVASISFKTISQSTTTNVYAPNGTTINGTFYPHGATVSLEGRDGVQVETTVCDRGMSFMKFEAITLIQAIARVSARIDPAVIGNLAGPQLSDAELEKLFGLPEGSVKDGKFTDPETGEEIAMFDKEKGYVNPKDKNQTFKDGYLIVTDEEGNITKYAVIENAEISVLNGEGDNGTNTFESAEGEFILVDVAEIDEANLPKAGEKVMFMGDVRADVNGNMTMAVNTSYTTEFGDGMVVGDAEIEAVKTEISAGLSSNLEWVKNNTAQNQQLFVDKGATGAGLRAQWNTLVEAAGYTTPEKDQEILEQLKKMKEGQIQAQF